MNMRHVKFIVLLVTVLLLAGWTKAFCLEQKRWLGYLVDKQCAESVKGTSQAESFVQAHTKDCALMCKDKGYVLYSEGKWFYLDAQGNNLALKMLHESKRARGFYVEVTGKAINQTLLVESIGEAPEPKGNKHNGVNHNVTH